MRSILVLVSFCLACACAAQTPQSSPAPTPASKMTPSVANELQGYKLKLDVLQTFDTINTALDGFANPNAIFRGRYQAFQAVMDGTARKINETADPFAKNFPEADVAIRKAGFSTRQYMLVYCIVMEAYLTPVAPAGGALPPGLSRANVDLLRVHSDLTRQIVEHVVKQSGVE